MHVAFFRRVGKENRIFGALRDYCWANLPITNLRAVARHFTSPPPRRVLCASPVPGRHGIAGGRDEPNCECFRWRYSAELQIKQSVVIAIVCRRRYAFLLSPRSCFSHGRFPIVPPDARMFDAGSGSGTFPASSFSIETPATVTKYRGGMQVRNQFEYGPAVLHRSHPGATQT